MSRCASCAPWKAPKAWTPKASVPARARQAIRLSEEFSDEDDFERHLIEDCGTSVKSNGSVSASFALVWRFADDPQSALITAVNLGGDTDTIAAIIGSMTGVLRCFPSSPSSSALQLMPIAPLS